MAELLYKTESPLSGRAKERSLEKCSSDSMYIFTVEYRETAKDLHLTGWVRNMYNGNVEMEVQGNSVMIERLFQELHSDRFIRIEKTEMIQIPTVDDEADFSVRG